MPRPIALLEQHHKPSGPERRLLGRRRHLARPRSSRHVTVMPPNRLAQAALAQIDMSYMEARTTTQRWLLGLGIVQAILSASVAVSQDFEKVSILRIDTYLDAGWKLPGSLLLALTTLATGALLVATEPRRRPISGILHCIHEQAFDPGLAGNSISRKVTLFVLRERRKALGLGALWRRCRNDSATHMLVPKYRFPRDARKPRRKFRVDKSDSSLCEGVAGLVFQSNGKFIVRQDLPGLSGESDVSAFKDFADQTNDNPSVLRTFGHYDIRSIGGIQVLAPDDSKIVGVLMFDSADPQGVAESIQGKSSLKSTLGALSRAIYA